MKNLDERPCSNCNTAKKTVAFDIEKKKKRNLPPFRKFWARNRKKEKGNGEMSKMHMHRMTKIQKIMTNRSNQK